VANPLNLINLKPNIVGLFVFENNYFNVKQIHQRDGDEHDMSSIGIPGNYLYILSSVKFQEYIYVPVSYTICIPYLKRIRKLLGWPKNSIR